MGGGVTLAILDEAMAWVAIAIGGKCAGTAETTTRFERPVLVGRDSVVEARLAAQNEERIDADATVFYGAGKDCAQAVRTTGADPAALDSSILK